MLFRHSAAATIVAASLLAAAANAVPTSEYLTKAAAGDLYERKSSEIVLQSTRDPNVRGFANTMIADHTKSSKLIAMAAGRSGEKAPKAMLSADQTAMVSALTIARGPDRDKLYVEQQKTAHAQALALHQDYAATGDKAPLKAVAEKTVPVVQHHIEMLSGMGSM